MISPHTVQSPLTFLNLHWILYRLCHMFITYGYLDPISLSSVSIRMCFGVLVPKFFSDACFGAVLAELVWFLYCDVHHVLCLSITCLYWSSEWYQVSLFLYSCRDALLCFWITMIFAFTNHKQMHSLSE